MDVTYFNKNVRHWCISKQHPIIYIFNDKQIDFGCESVAQGTKLLDSWSISCLSGLPIGNFLLYMTLS